MDLVPEQDAGGALRFRPVLGGSFFNVALCLGRLGADVAYLWELSDDTFGRLFGAALAEAGVRLDLVVPSRRMTPVAVVDLAGAEPRYQIADPDAVMKTFDPPAPQRWAAPATVLQTGSAILALEPVGSRMEAMIGALPDHVLLSLDINVRPPAISDLCAYRDRLERLFRRAAIVKASDADLDFLYGAAAPQAHLGRLRESGVALAVVTLGPDGAAAMSHSSHAEMPAVQTNVVDSVGAGDGFTAGLLAALARLALLSQPALEVLSGEQILAVLAHAQAVAAAVCRSRGAQMPWREDLERGLARQGSVEEYVV